jgi:hypothetical protein
LILWSTRRRSTFWDPREICKDANISGIGYTKANRRSTDSRRDGNPKQERRQRKSGKNYKTHPIT